MEGQTAPQPGGGPRRLVIIGATLGSVLIVVGAVIVIVVLPSLKPTEPTLSITVAYEKGGNWTQNWTMARCSRYNVTVTMSSPVNVTVTNVTFGYVTFNPTYGRGPQLVGKTMSLRVTEVKVSITLEVDTCKGITKLDPEICVTFEASVDVTYSYPLGRNTQHSIAPEFTVCA